MQVLVDSGTWKYVNPTDVRFEDGSFTVAGRWAPGWGPFKPQKLRYAWEDFPQCAIYNGVGGPDNHTGVAAAPFRRALPRASGGSPCPAGSTACTGSPEGATQCCTSATTARYPMGEVCKNAAGCLNGAQK